MWICIDNVDMYNSGCVYIFTIYLCIYMNIVCICKDNVYIQVYCLKPLLL